MATSKPNPPNTTCTTTISSPFTGLPKLNWWGLVDLYQWEGFWYHDIVLEAAMAAKSSFIALDDDVFVAASPKTGSTWLKALVASIIHRGGGDGGGDCEGGNEDDEDADDPLRYHHPNDLVPSLELQVCRKNGKLDLPNMASPRLFRTHISYSLLPESIKTSSCKIVYITRDPKDVFVSLWHFMNTQRSPEQGPFPFDDAFKSFCNGFHSFGPFHEHVLQFWNESLTSPKKILFLKYEDLKREPKGEVLKLASFLGRPLADDGEAEKIVQRCSIERLKNLEVNRDGVDPWSGFPKSSYFRLGLVGDWKNKLSMEMKDRLDEITRVKFEGSDLSI
ncbi:hypothetical protein CsSME_00030090 [Camellia sinensis var. sinensis]